MRKLAIIFGALLLLGGLASIGFRAWLDFKISAKPGALAMASIQDPEGAHSYLQMMAALLYAGIGGIVVGGVFLVGGILAGKRGAASTPVPPAAPHP